MSQPLPARANEIQVAENDDRIHIQTPQLEAEIRKQGYVTGIAAGSFLDRASGFRDAGFGLDIVDWIMEPGSDEAYREKLPDHMVYRFGNDYHGDRAKRSIEGPQICTKAGRLDPKVIRGEDFVAVRQSYRYHLAAPGRKHGSTWTQTIVFPAGKRYFLSSDRIDAVNDSDAMFLRIDMPGHIKHTRGDTFSEIYLSYPTTGEIPAEHVRTAGEGQIIAAAAFADNFPPDAALNYRRADGDSAKRFIRAYRLRDGKTGRDGPWLAGMTLDPAVVHEAWCHQRGYVCMIQEFGGRPTKAGESFNGAFVVGFFDSIDEMHEVYDQYAGHNELSFTADGWTLR